MSSPSVCRLCQCPLEVESVSGLCDTCQRAADATLDNPAPSPQPGEFPVPLDSESRDADAAASYRPDPIDGATGTFVPAAATRSYKPNDPARMPIAPAGYDLITRLGEGGMGDVWLAREQLAGRLVAMKFLRLAGRSGSLERFTLELRTIASLDHPNIIRLITYDLVRTEPYITMEFAAGGSLDRWVRTHGPLAPMEAARLIAAIARAIAAAHDHEPQYLHRDVKPSNILLVVPSDSPTEIPPAPVAISEVIPKVGDFGLVKWMDEESITVGSGPIGTPPYMPPEQANKKNGEAGPASDVYGLGATLYFLLTGNPPFTGDTHAETMYRVLTDPVPRPRAVRADVPLELDGIVVKCLEKDTKDRYQTATELAKDLEAFLSNKIEDIVAPRQTVVRRARRWAGRHRKSLAVTGLFVALLGVLGFYWPWPPKPAIDPVVVMQQELAAGRSVVLIGENGLPQYSRSRLENVALESSPLRGGGVVFHAFNVGLVELFPDPGIDRYRVSLDISQHQSRGSQDPNVSEMEYVGFYFGYSECVLPDNTTAHAMFGVTFKDYPPPVRPPPKKTPPRAVFVKSLEFSQEPDRLLPADTVNLAARVFTPKATRPGDWRPLVIEVTPDGVLIQWLDEAPPAGTGGMVTLTRLATDDLRRQYAAAARKKAGQTVLPEWSPRLPFGVIAHRSSVALRNVVLSPLP